MSSPPPVIAIDGPGGAGKGTIASHLAAELGWHLLDSGALYRLTAFACREQGADWGDEAAAADIAHHLEARFEHGSENSIRIFHRGEDATASLRAEEIGQGASIVAAMPQVRAALLERQRAFRRPPGLVADGRDMGTVVFPDAPLKFFLTASPEERARRRLSQLTSGHLPAGERDAKLAGLLRDIRERDERDSSRSVSPMSPAQDAIVIDSTAMPIRTVVRKVMDAATARLGVQASNGPGVCKT